MVKAANKLIHFAKRADRGQPSPLNLLRGRVATEQVYKKLLMETVPKLSNINQNYVKIEQGIKRRRGDNAPMVHVTIKHSEKEDVLSLQAKEEKQRRKDVTVRSYSHRILAEEKAHYEKLAAQNPEQEAFFQRKIARVEFDQWVLEKSKGERRLQLLV